MHEIICDKCGDAISNEFNHTLLFCTSCGASLNLAGNLMTLALPDSESSVSPADQPEKAQTGKRLRYLLGGSALCGALVLTAAGFYFYPPSNWTKQYHCSIPGEPEPQTSDDYYDRALKHIEFYSADGPDVDDCAFGALNEALRLDPNNVEARQGRGYAYKQRKQYALAEADFDMAVRLAPDNLQNYYFRRFLYEEWEKFDKAVENQSAILDHYLKADPVDKERLIEVYQKRAELYKKYRDFENAIKDYTEIIRLKPNSLYGYPARADAYRDKGDFENAVKDYTEVIRLEPYKANHYYLRAAAYRKLGQKDLADADERMAREAYELNK